VTTVAPPRRRVGDDDRTTVLRAEARALMDAARSPSAEVHLVDGQLFVADGSRVYDAAPALVAEVERSVAAGSEHELLDRLGLGGEPFVADAPLAPPPVHAVSLAVAQTCNLGCTYCYAQQGDFGGTAKQMPLDVAERTVALLVAGAEPGSSVNVAFLGGEPLANRRVLRAATERAAALGAERGVRVTFSVTTNGTLVRPDDAEFFERHGFAVTVSLDGPRDVHDRLRPYRDGRGSFDTIMERVVPLLAGARRMQVSARVTVTPGNLMVRRTVDELVERGFSSVGVSPMLSAPNGHGELQAAELEVLLGEMVDTGREHERRAWAGERYPFANLENALREIDRGTHRPYPCGAGAGYLGVSAEGDLSACHRFVGDDAGAMGSLDDGIDDVARAGWLADRHVHRQEPCRSCWARYLCGGGCHHEVIHRGRPACDFIRGWLHYCLGAYGRLLPLREATKGP
jgi:uncharacterized protein